MDEMPVEKSGPGVVALCQHHAHTERQMSNSIETKTISEKNKDRADIIEKAISNAGREWEDHRDARTKIFGELQGTKIPTIKLCDKYINIEDRNHPPYELSDEAIAVFCSLTDAIKKSGLEDLSDTADDLALAHDIQLLR